MASKPDKKTNGSGDAAPIWVTLFAEPPKCFRPERIPDIVTTVGKFTVRQHFPVRLEKTSVPQATELLRTAARQKIFAEDTPHIGQDEL
jgi:hypothetical protein